MGEDEGRQENLLQRIEKRRNEKRDISNERCYDCDDSKKKLISKKWEVEDGRNGETEKE